MNSAGTCRIRPSVNIANIPINDVASPPVMNPFVPPKAVPTSGSSSSAGPSKTPLTDKLVPTGFQSTTNGVTKTEIAGTTTTITDTAVARSTPNPSGTTNYGTNDLIQYTPDQSDWTTMNQLSLKGGNDHSPTGITWVKEWPKWDGKQIDLRNLKGKQVAAAICSNGIIRDAEVIYNQRPFADPKNPTKAEVDDLHIRTIRYIRKMVGIEDVVPIEFDRCLCSIALWSQEILSIPTKWESIPQYSNVSKTNCFKAGHCDFAPSPEDQSSPMRGLTFNGQRNNQVCTTAMSGSEGIASTNADIPWAIKFHRPICQFLREGTSGHAGPIFRRTKMCPIFWHTPGSKSATVRFKNGGKRFDKLYWDTK